MGSRLIQPHSALPPDRRKVVVCEICGGLGQPKDILVCPKCKISREHVYCRKILSRKNYNDWSCDDCEAKKIESSGYVCDKGTHLSVKGKHSVVEKIVTKGKVKYIPSQEAIKLSSGSRRGEAPAKNIKQIKSPSLKIDEPMPTKASVHQRGSPLKSPTISGPLPKNQQDHSLNKRSKISHDPRELKAVQASRRELVQRVEPNSTMAPPKTKDAGLVKATDIQREALTSPAKPSPLTIHSAAVKPPVGTKLASSAEKISRPSEASSIWSQEKQLPPSTSSAMPAAETKVTSPRKEVDVPKEASLKKQIRTPSGYQVDDDVYPEVSDVGNLVLKNAVLEADKFSRSPAHDSSWKGRVEVLVDAFRNVYFEFEAHPCSSGSRKVLDSAKRMPQLLQLTPIHQKEVWGNLFKDNCPNEDDIGLYFFSSENKRTSGYNLILMFVEAQDCAMKCVLPGVELYIFSSKILSADYQKIDGEYFLWGIFHKKQKDVSELYNELPSAVHKPSSDSLKNNEITNNDDDDDCAIDMEIDMIGGHDLEEMKVVSRDYSHVGYQNPLLDCPPGFEEMYKMKSQKN